MMGIRSLRPLLVLTAFAVLGTSGAGAQTTVVVGGAAAVPLAEFGAVADLGFQGYVGGLLDVGTTGFAVGMTGFYGSNPHELAGDRSDLYGATVLAGYTIAEAYDLRLRAWAGLGGMVHARKSDTFPGLDAAKRGVSVSAGAGVSKPVGRVSVFVSGLYTRGLGALGTSTYPTEFVTLGGGVAIPLAVD